MAGAHRTGQVALAFVVTRLLQRSLPEAVKVSESEQTPVRTGSVPEKVVPWPGSNRAIVVTGVPADGWLLTITMLVIGTLPTLVMVAVNPRTPPGRPLVAGQLLARSNRGAGGVLLQVVEAVVEAKTTPQAVLAVAVKVSGKGAQGL